MKISTYPSNLASNSLLPSHKNLDAQFSYQFYTIDEMTSEAESPRKKTYKNDSDISKRSPRFNTITFNRQLQVQTSKTNRTEEVKKNIDKIYSAEDIGNSSYTSVISQDSSISDRIYRTIMRSANIRGISGNMSDISMDLGKSLGSSLDREILQDLSISYQNAGAEFQSDRNMISPGKFKNVESFQSFITVNDKFVFDFMNGSQNNFSPGNSVSIGLSAKDVERYQEKARSRTATISSADFMTILNPIELKESSDGEFIHGIEQIATLIYRQELLQDGSKEDRLLEVLSPDATSYVDFSIKLGSQYFYWSHAVYVVNMNVLSEDTEQILRAEVLFQSSPSNTSHVFSIDSKAPAHPADFNVTWDYYSHMLALSWNFPPNRRRDIKYFQIFRRKSVESPFELLAEYDFNDSLQQPSRFENVNEMLVQKLADPLTVYIDKQFRKDSKFVYAVASVDARGKVSNYSEQIEVSFDIIKNRLVKNVISTSGAPRQYPNVFIKKSFFSDAIFTSKKRRAFIYFDPEYLQIKSANGSIIDSVIEKESGKYTMNVLDISRAQSDSVFIEIDNLLKT